MKIKIGLFLTMKTFAENEPILFFVVFLAAENKDLLFFGVFFSCHRKLALFSARTLRRLETDENKPKPPKIAYFRWFFAQKNESNYCSVARGYFSCTTAQCMSSMEFHHFCVSNFKWPTAQFTLATK
jgi:hypothetical protein